MTFEQKLANLFGLNDETWMRHANPTSVYTRYSVLPILLLAIWSRTWIGAWSVLPIALSILWMFMNPLVFQKPRSTKNWASKAVLGERVLLNRESIPLPEHHSTDFFNFLNGIAGIGFLLAIWSSISYSLTGVCVGTLLAYLGKSWFLDRMVWLFEDMKHQDPSYRSWEY